MAENTNVDVVASSLKKHGESLNSWLESVGLMMTVGSMREETSVLVAIGMDRKVIPMQVQPGTLMAVFSAYDFQYRVYHTYAEKEEGPRRKMPNYELLYEPFFDRRRARFTKGIPKKPGVYLWRGPVTVSDCPEWDDKLRIDIALDMGDGPWPADPGEWTGPLREVPVLEPAIYPPVRAEDVVKVARVIAPLREAIMRMRPQYFNRRFGWGHEKYGTWPYFMFGEKERLEIQPWFAECDPGPPFESRELLGIALFDDHHDDEYGHNKLATIEVTQDTIEETAKQIVDGYESGKFLGEDE